MQDGQVPPPQTKWLLYEVSGSSEVNKEKVSEKVSGSSEVNKDDNYNTGGSWNVFMYKQNYPAVGSSPWLKFVDWTIIE